MEYATLYRCGVTVESVRIGQLVWLTQYLAAAVGGVFEFTRNASANLRQKHDHYNNGIAGFFAGAVLGLQGESIGTPSGCYTFGR